VPSVCCIFSNFVLPRSPFRTRKYGLVWRGRLDALWPVVKLAMLAGCKPEVEIAPSMSAIISRRGDVCDVTSGATYSLLGVFFLLSIYLSFFLSFFIPRVISAVTHPIFVIFLSTTCHDSGFQTQSSDFK